MLSFLCEMISHRLCKKIPFSSPLVCLASSTDVCLLCRMHLRGGENGNAKHFSSHALLLCLRDWISATAGWLWRNSSCPLEAVKQCLLNCTHVNACPPSSETNGRPVSLSVKRLVCVYHRVTFFSHPGWPFCCHLGFSPNASKPKVFCSERRVTEGKGSRRRRRQV